MPASVVRFPRVLALGVLLALVLAGAAAAGGGGLAPPSAASPNEGGIRAIYWLILGVTGAIFVLVEGALILFIFRYRSRGRARAVEGPQVIGHTKLELAWTAAPVVILAVIAGFVFWKAPGISHASAAGVGGPNQAIQVQGHQFYWQFVYPNGAISIDTLRIPVNQKIELAITSPDVAHSWWVPALGGKLDAIPGRVNHMSIRATKDGSYRGQCAEFCGLQHAAMIAHVEVLEREDYEAWVTGRGRQPSELGRETFEGVCAKCHGLSGQGDIGPPISQSPILGDREALTTIIRHGGVRMPPVGKTWSDAQLNSLIGYLHTRFKTGGTSGG